MVEQETTQTRPSAPAPQTATAAPSGGPRRRPGGGFAPRRKVCRFCAEQIPHVDWKQFQLLRGFTTERGRILSSRVTGTCAKHQRQVAVAVKRARFLAILPFLAN